MGRAALITGGTRGIGTAIAKTLKTEGLMIAATYAGNDEAANKFKCETGIAVFKCVGGRPHGPFLVSEALGPDQRSPSMELKTWRKAKT